ncbi:hypothetical protein ACLB2K_045636 [Fragaria x ananassa]
MMIAKSSRGPVRVCSSTMIKSSSCSSEKAANASSGQIKKKIMSTATKKQAPKENKMVVSSCGQMKKRVLVSPPPSQPASKHFKGKDTKRVALLGEPDIKSESKKTMKEVLSEVSKTRCYQELQSWISQQKKQQQIQKRLQEEKEKAAKLEQEKQEKEKREKDRQETKLALYRMKPVLDLEPSWCSILTQLQALPGFDAASWGGVLAVN